MYMPTWPGPEDEILRACPVSSPKRRQSASSAEHRKDSGFRSLGDPTTLTDTRTHTYTHICAPARALTHHKHTHTLTRSLTPSHAHLPAPPGAPSPPVLIIILILTRGESPSLLALALEPSMESHCAPSPNARCTSASPWAWYLDLDKALGGSPCKTSRLFLESIKFRHSIARPPRLICLHARLSVRLSACLPVSLPARRPACGLPACLPACLLSPRPAWSLIAPDLHWQCGTWARAHQPCSSVSRAWSLVPSHTRALPRTADHHLPSSLSVSRACYTHVLLPVVGSSLLLALPLLLSQSFLSSFPPPTSPLDSIIPRCLPPSSFYVRFAHPIL